MLVKLTPCAPFVVNDSLLSKTTSAMMKAMAEMRKRNPSHKMLENQNVRGWTPVISWTWVQFSQYVKIKSVKKCKHNMLNLLTCGQFHQHFTRTLFILTSFWQLFSSYMYVEKRRLLVRNIRTFNVDEIDTLCKMSLVQRGGQLFLSAGHNGLFCLGGQIQVKYMLFQS